MKRPKTTVWLEPNIMIYGPKLDPKSPGYKESDHRLNEQLDIGLVQLFRDLNISARKHLPEFRLVIG